MISSTRLILVVFLLMPIAKLIGAMCIVAEAMLFCIDSFYTALHSHVAHFSVACVFLVGSFAPRRKYLPALLVGKRRYSKRYKRKSFFEHYGHCCQCFREQVLCLLLPSKQLQNDILTVPFGLHRAHPWHKLLWRFCLM